MAFQFSGIGSPYFYLAFIMVICLGNSGLVAADCSNTSIGLESFYIIPNNSLTASSYYNGKYIPSNARLNGYNGWGPGKPRRDNEFLQVDLGYPYVICAIATQGSSEVDEWVKEYKVMTSVYGTEWNEYEENGKVTIFTGNSDRNTIVKNTMKKTLARYVRIYPTSSEVWNTMRVGLFGYPETCDNLPLGMESKVIQHITASSGQDPATRSRLRYPGTSWCASRSDAIPYLQIDLGSYHLICALATQGNSQTDQWVKTYQIDTSTDGTIWTTYQENNIDRVFVGNFDRSTVLRQVLFYGTVTRYIRIKPKTFENTPCLRTEIYGYRVNQTCSRHSLGLPSSNMVPDYRFTSTSHFNQKHQTFMARLGLRGAWGPTEKESFDYIQIDLGTMAYICSVESQGNGNPSLYEWITKYQVLYSTSNNQWITYRENGMDKEFPGNTDQSTVAINSIKNLFKAKFIRILPKDFNRWKSIRLDFKGLPAACVSSLGLENSNIPDSQITSSSLSDNSHTAAHGRLYGSSSWCSSSSSNSEYIQVDLGEVKTVTGVATQGDKDLNKWVTSYKVSYSFLSDRNWNELAKVFSGNNNNTDVIVNWFSRPITALYVRILPQSNNGGPCLRLDLYGCTYHIPERPSTSIVVSASERAATLRWTNIQTHEGTAERFTISVSNRTGLTQYIIVQSQPTTSKEITNLMPCTIYDVKIIAVKTDGRHLWKSFLKFQTLMAGTSETNSSNSSLCTTENDTITLCCLANHEQASSVRYTWTKNGEVVVGGDSAVKMEENKLIVNSVREDDFGSYECNAANKTIRYELKKCLEEADPSINVLVKSKVTNITVKQEEDIKLNCSLDGDGVTWKHGNGSEITLSKRIKIIEKILEISKALPSDAGAYVCSKMTPQGRVSYQVNLRVNVTIKVFMALRILNRNFTKQLQNNTTQEYKNFVKDFKEQMNIVFKNVDGYVGIEILEIFNGSVRVRFRVIVTLVVKDNKDGGTVTKKRVIVTQRVVTKAKTGWVEDLQVDKNPKSMELNKSPPPRPENPTLIEAFEDKVEISWELPLNHEYFDINGYFIEYWELSAVKKKRTTTIKGQRAIISGLEADSPYTGWVVAENENGIRGEESAKIEFTTKGTKEMPTWVLAIIILFVIIILIVVIAIIIVCCRRKTSSRNRMSDEGLNMEELQEEEGADVHPKSYVNTVFSIDEKLPSFAREDLVFKEELGSGEFGVVFKGQLLEKGKTKECAVKTIKNTTNVEDYRELRQELDIMANVGYHPNLVNLIGCCVEDEKLFVIVEFARNGSLLEYLREARAKPEEKLEFDLNYFNRLKIALEVAKGMSHLAQKRCVHRDLAARNVLLADGFVAKVADFGLSRDIYETGEYEKTTVQGKLPTRWMAIESLELRRFTMQSDVWSFGVLLWEIETKGLMPHGAISFKELLNKQKGGYRLEQPTGTPDELYHVMQMCWQANPQQRPTFAQICDTLEQRLYDIQASNGNFEINQGSKKQEDNIYHQTFA